MSSIPYCSQPLPRWSRFEEYRLNIVNSWPDSDPRKTSTLAAIQQRLNSELQREAAQPHLYVR